jgi:hypothetical protein
LAWSSGALFFCVSVVFNRRYHLNWKIRFYKTKMNVEKTFSSLKRRCETGEEEDKWPDSDNSR